MMLVSYTVYNDYKQTGDIDMTLKQIRRQMDSGLTTAQDWIGTSVKIGFLELVITGYEPTPGDYLPNIWHLSRNGVDYEFVPHHGLTRL